MKQTHPGPVRPLSETQFGAGDVSRAIVQVASFFRRHLWLWPLMLAVVLGGIAFWMQGSLERTIKQQMAADLDRILEADVKALELWLGIRIGEAKAAVLDPEINSLARKLLARTDSLAEFKPAAARDELDAFRKFMEPRFEALGFTDFFVADPKLRVVASMRDDAVGKTLTEYRHDFFESVLAGEARSSIPYKAVLSLDDGSGGKKEGLPTMLTAAPLRDEGGKIYGVLAFRIQPEKEFSQILGLARFGETGETYAFNKEGVMLSESRFNDQLQIAGLLPKDLAKEDPKGLSTLRIKVTDPGVNLVETNGVGPKSEEPTKMVRHCLDNKKGFDVDGYRDYRGVPVIGAWKWLEKYGFGVATEAEVAEAFAPLKRLQLIFWILIALLLVGGLVMLVLMIVLDRRQAALRKAVLEMKRLGQYQLDDKLGQGGMGSVYRAHHDLMRRPTAVKLLDAHNISPLSISRFEREVQHTSRLTHPNTIAIYDYGRTPEGIFYYAMEYLDGLDLDGLIEKYGPQSEGRTIFILLQICGSLSEAHREHLIHRDVKPANVMLTDRGGCADFVKVLDFGLVQTAGEEDKHAKGGYAGTALYLAPEGVTSGAKVDHRADIYAVGAIGYYLLTGTPPFMGNNDVAVLSASVNDPLELPSARRGKPITADLEAAVVKCLQKKPGDRFQSIDELTEALVRCEANGSWTPKMAKDWWEAWKVLRNLKQTSRKAVAALSGEIPTVAAATATNWG